GTEELSEINKDRSIPVAGDGSLMMPRLDYEGEFLRGVCGIHVEPIGYTVVCLTADGAILGRDPQRAWQKFQKLPAVERMAGAVTVEDPGEIDPAAVPPQPPPGGLILKIYARPLARDGDGEISLARPTDFLTPDPQSPDFQTVLKASPDHMWLMRDEWQALVPANPHQNQRLPVPSAITQRLICYHLVPTRIYTSGKPWTTKNVRAGN